jgi:methyl-accepting chemotaxis protein
VTNTIASTSATVDATAAAAAEMLRTMQHLTDAMEPMKKAIAQNTTTAQELANSASSLACTMGSMDSTAEDLHQQSQMLKGLIADFTISRDAQPVPVPSESATSGTFSNAPVVTLEGGTLELF